MSDPLPRSGLDKGFQEMLTFGYGKDVGTIQGGIPTLAALMSMNPNLQIVRRFTWLHIRALLDVQIELQALENELKMLDSVEANTLGSITKQYGSENACRIMKTNLSEESNAQVYRHKVDAPDDSFDRRKWLMKSIRERLREYGDLADQQARFHDLKVPGPLALQHVRLFLDQLGDSLGNDATAWFRHGHAAHDLRTLTPKRNRAWAEVVADIFTAALVQPNQALTRLKTPLMRLLGQMAYSRGYGARYLYGCVKAVQMAVQYYGAFALLLVPVYLLHHNIDNWTRGEKFGEVMLWNFYFSVFTFFFITTDLQSLIPIVVSYCGILVVFLGLSSKNPAG